MSDRPTQPTQPAVENQSSSTPGSVAPPRVEQDRSAPGAVTNQQEAKPSFLQVPPVAPSQPASQPETTPAPQPSVDLAAQLAQERAAREQLQAQTRQYQAAIDQVRQYAETQQQSQAQQQQIDMLLAQADAMP